MMKKLSIVFACLSLMTGARGQFLWEHKTADAWINPETKKVDSLICFTAISCHENNCTAAGILFNAPINPIGRLAFYRSDDGGLTWVEQPNDLPNKDQWLLNYGVTKIQQIDSLNVVAMVDEDAVIRSTNGGKSWYRIDCPVNRKQFDIHFSDPFTGILTCSGADSNLFTTTDGGEHWTLHRSMPSSVSCYSYGNGKFRVHRYGYGPIFTTYDNFATLDSTELVFDTLMYPKFRYVFGTMTFSKSDTIFAHGSLWPGDADDTLTRSYGVIMRSTDNGQSWEMPTFYPEFSRIKTISSVERDTIFIGGSIYHYLFSFDHGKTWTLDSVRMDTNYYNDKCFGIAVAADGSPIAIFGPGPLPLYSVIARGVKQPSRVEGVTEMIKYYTRLYPNPTVGIINIESIDKTAPTVTVVDIFGSELLTSRLSKEGKLTVDLSPLVPGVYNIVFDHLGKEFIVGKAVVVE